MNGVILAGARAIWMESFEISRCCCGTKNVLQRFNWLMYVLEFLKRIESRKLRVTIQSMALNWLLMPFFYIVVPLWQKITTRLFFFLSLWSILYIFQKKSSYASASAVNRQPSTTNTQQKNWPLFKKKKKNFYWFFFSSLFWKFDGSNHLSCVVALYSFTQRVTSFNSKQ